MRDIMKEFFAAYYDRLQILHRDLQAALADLPQEVLDWKPAPKMNSLAVLVVHTAGAERYWIGDVAGQDPSGRIRSEEFQVIGLDAEELGQRLDAALEHSHDILQQLTEEDLDAARHSTRDGETYSVAWALAHALEHTAVHLGHIQTLRDMWQYELAGPD